LAKENGILPSMSFAKLESVMPMPGLLDVQLQSFNKLMNESGEEEPWEFSLDRIFRDIFPIRSTNGDLTLEFVSARRDKPKYSVEECIERDMTYAAPLKAKLRLVVREKVPGRRKKAVIREIPEKEVYLGDLPLLTPLGTFIINGAERVVVSQLHRSPGVVFEEEIHTCAAYRCTDSTVPQSATRTWRVSGAVRSGPAQAI